MPDFPSKCSNPNRGRGTGGLRYSAAHSVSPNQPENFMGRGEGVRSAVPCRLVGARYTRFL